jgi:hypothetical protein
MKNIYFLIMTFIFISCDMGDNYKGFVQDNDTKSAIVVELADSYLAGNFDIARDYFTPDGKHFFNNLEFDVDGIIDGYNSHSLIFKDIKHNDREVYTGYFNDGSVETFHDFIWSATSIITGKEYNYPCHCRWVWEEDKITTTTCYVDPAAIFEESAIYAESQN